MQGRRGIGGRKRREEGEQWEREVELRGGEGKRGGGGEVQKGVDEEQRS